MPEDRYFVDTNLLLYAFDRRAPMKRASARQWLDYLWHTGAGRLSWQVLHEFYANAVRKIGIPAAEAQEAVRVFSGWQTAVVSLELVERAWSWTDRTQLSYWDGLILASAWRSGCGNLLSEDFQTGRDYGGVKVVNPFEQAPPGAHRLHS
jgi:predicted nucleic acid-binding protein